MRIRKNAKLSSILSSHASTPETLQTHVCQLNQSPWDVICFSQDSYPSLNHRFEGEDSFTGNGSLSNSMGAVESFASMIDGEEKAVMFKVDEMVMDDNEMVGLDNYSNEEFKIDNDEFGVEKDYKTLYCIKTDGKGWQCRNEPKHGHNLCEHHLSLLKSYSNSSITHSIKKSDKAMTFAVGSRRGRTRTCKKGSSSSNPYEFYYYSGFGPSWGKRRGDKIVEVKKCVVKEDESTLQNEKTPSSSQIDNDNEFNFVDDVDEDEENGDNGKKRMRKPVKARSLKSLM